MTTAEVIAAVGGIVGGVGGIVAGVGGIAAVILAVKSMRLSREAQKKIDEIVDDDRRYQQFLDRWTAKAIELINKEPGMGSKRRLKINEPENTQYIARAIREGRWEPAYEGNEYWVTK